MGLKPPAPRSGDEGMENTPTPARKSLSEQPLPPAPDTPAAPVKKKRKGGLTRGVALAVAAACGIAAGGVLYVSMAVSNVTATVVGYQLINPIVANQPILRENTVPVQIPVDAAPVNMLTGAELGSQTYYARIDIPASQVLTSVIASTATRTSTEIPSDWQVLSFQVPAENAVAGRIGPGDFVNMFVVPPSAMADNDINLAVPLFENLFILDARSGPGGDQIEGDPETYTGIPTTYIVGLPAEMAQLMIATQAAEVGMYLTLPAIPENGPGNPLQPGGQPKVSSYFGSLLEAMRAVSTWERTPADNSVPATSPVTPPAPAPSPVTPPAPAPAPEPEPGE